MAKRRTARVLRFPLSEDELEGLPTSNDSCVGWRPAPEYILQALEGGGVYDLRELTQRIRRLTSQPRAVDELTVLDAVDRLITEQKVHRERQGVVQRYRRKAS